MEHFSKTKITLMPLPEIIPDVIPDEKKPLEPEPSIEVEEDYEERKNIWPVSLVIHRILSDFLYHQV
ncbi:MAG: hypothetical protein YK1309IOTA_30014 [Marine Group I thaumarchaeote]|nr:MAG: hypothetical protein YK1309IOTA_30014 [Marine Group I thaumarchaeote]